MNWVIAGTICAGAIVAELVMSGDVSAFMKRLKQPRWALPLPAWIAIGFAYYAACFFTLQRLLSLGFDRPFAKASVATLIAIMAANAGFNWVFFRRRNLRGSFLYYFPYAGLIAALIALLSQVDGVLALVFIVYACYLPYAMLWSHRVWQLNAHEGKPL